MGLCSIMPVLITVCLTWKVFLILLWCLPTPYYTTTQKPHRKWYLQGWEEESIPIFIKVKWYGSWFFLFQHVILLTVLFACLSWSKIKWLRTWQILAFSFNHYQSLDIAFRASLHKICEKQRASLACWLNSQQHFPLPSAVFIII